MPTHPQKKTKKYVQKIFTFARGLTAVINIYIIQIIKFFLPKKTCFLINADVDVCLGMSKYFP